MAGWLAVYKSASINTYNLVNCLSFNHEMVCVSLVVWLMSVMNLNNEVKFSHKAEES